MFLRVRGCSDSGDLRVARTGCAAVGGARACWGEEAGSFGEMFALHEQASCVRCAGRAMHVGAQGRGHPSPAAIAVTLDRPILLVQRASFNSAASRYARRRPLLLRLSCP